MLSHLGHAAGHPCSAWPRVTTLSYEYRSQASARGTSRVEQKKKRFEKKETDEVEYMAIFSTFFCICLVFSPSNRLNEGIS